MPSVASHLWEERGGADTSAGLSCNSSFRRVQYSKCGSRASTARSLQATGAAVSDLQTIGPLVVDKQPQEIVLRFYAAEDSYLAVPPNLGDDLAALAAGDADAFTNRRLVFDLVGLHGLSSRHLGILVTAAKALRPWGGLRLRGVSPEMQRLLDVTQIVQLFPLSDD